MLRTASRYTVTHTPHSGKAKSLYQLVVVGLINRRWLVGLVAGRMNPSRRNERHAIAAFETHARALARHQSRLVAL